MAEEKQGFIKEFKEFAVKGNAVDLAIGVIIGAAFGAVVNSVVKDIIMPVIGRVLGNSDFSNFFVSLSGTKYATLAEAQAAGAPTLNYGLFINALIGFIIVAFVLFMIVKSMNKMRKAEEAEPEPSVRDCPFCVTSIPLKATRCPACTSELSPVD